MPAEVQDQSSSPPLPADFGLRRVSADSRQPADDHTRILIDLPPEGARVLEQLLKDTDNDLPGLFQKALALYRLSKAAVQEGKFVGIATSEDDLETEFVGL